ncbi:HTH-type transcriptional regulator YesS [compost metagenome]
MRLLQFYRSRKYFKRIFYTNTLLVVLFLLIFCSVLYVNSRSTALNLQQDANHKVLNQINYNIDNLNEMVKNLTVSTFNDRDITALMNSSEIDMFQFYNKLNKMNQILISNPFLSSVAIFNGANGCYYSTAFNSPISCGNNEPNNLLGSFLKEHKTFPKLVLLPLEETKGTSVQTVFSYLIYNSAGDYSKNESVLMMNVKPEWLFDNIRVMNEIADNSTGDAFIIDSKGKLFSPSGSMMQDESILKVLDEKFAQIGNNSGYFIAKTGKNKQIVSYMTSKVNNWKVVSVQPYDAVFGRINQIGTFSIIALLIFVALSLLISALVSVKLYTPVGKLLNQMKLLPSLEREWMNGDRDELSYLSSVYQDMEEKMSVLQVDHLSNQHVLSHYFLRRWITDSTSITAQEYKDYTVERNLPAEPAFLLCLLKIDDYAEFRDSRSELEKKLCKFAVTNIVEEVIGESHSNQAVDMMNDYLIVLIHLPQADTDAYTLFIDKMKYVQETISEYYKLSITAVFGEAFTDYRRMSTHYEMTLTLSMYRLTLGKKAIITPAVYRDRDHQTDDQIPYDLEKRFVESIKSNQQEAIQARLNEIIQVIAQFHYTNIDFAVLHVLLIINQTIRELNHNNVQAVMSNLKRYTNKVLEQETLVDIHTCIEQMLQELANERNVVKHEKNEFLVAAVKDIVQLNYSDPNLSLQAIADMMKMSSGYLGRYFRSSESESVAEYLNQIRLNKAVAMLEQSEESIIEIMRLVGYSNESNFFKLFKKKFGATPKEYRLKKINSQIRP